MGRLKIVQTVPVDRDEHLIVLVTYLYYQDAINGDT
jgi:hypothetical protein